MVAIGRHINGISLNPLEYVLDGPDPDSPVKTFPNEKIAREYLLSEGFQEEDLDSFQYPEYSLALDKVLT
jgi:hypothetical protein